MTFLKAATGAAESFYAGIQHADCRCYYYTQLPWFSNTVFYKKQDIYVLALL